MTIEDAIAAKLKGIFSKKTQAPQGSPMPAGGDAPTPGPLPGSNPPPLTPQGTEMITQETPFGNTSNVESSMKITELGTPGGSERGAQGAEGTLTPQAMQEMMRPSTPQGAPMTQGMPPKHPGMPMTPPTSGPAPETTPLLSEAQEYEKKQIREQVVQRHRRDDKTEIMMMKIERLDQRIDLVNSKMDMLRDEIRSITELLRQWRGY